MPTHVLALQQQRGHEAFGGTPGTHTDHRAPKMSRVVIVPRSRKIQQTFLTVTFTFFHCFFLILELPFFYGD